MARRWSKELELVGAGGEPVDLRRTLASHGVAELPPNAIDEEARTLTTTLALRHGAATVRVGPGREGYASVEGSGPSAGARDAIRHMLRLDADLSAFYAVARADDGLAWVAAGAGRMMRSPTVFEDVVKTICTTNCAWSATVRMVSALVAELGEPAAGSDRRAFPTAGAMAAAEEAFYRDVVRAGYRGAYLRRLAADVADGRIDLEAWAEASTDELPDEELERELLELPGVGPYAAAHVMLLLGRASRLVLDSWTRPTYARVSGGRPVPDARIVRRFRR